MVGIAEHCWCEYDGNIIEPSYEYVIQNNRYRKNVEYVKTFKELTTLITSRESATECIRNRAKFERIVNVVLNNNCEYDAKYQKAFAKWFDAKTK